MMRRYLSLFIVIFFFTLLYGCAINPVTGRRELTLVSEAGEIKIGEENYLFSRQSQGGQYIVEPELTAYVNAVGQRIARVSDRPHLPYEFVVLNNSVPNAWALPGGKIAVNRGLLLELKSEAELAAVLAHEIIHAAARHGAKSIERGLVLQTGLIGVGLAVSDSRSRNIAVGAASVGAALVNRRYSRSAELEADYYGMKYMTLAGYDPEAAIALQKTFVRLSKEKRSNWLSGLFATHPPSQERVDANVATAADLPQGGRIGDEEYQSKIGGLKKTKAAYEAHDRGRTFLDKGKMTKALHSADRAIAGEPGEALFYGLKGDTRAKQGRYREALSDYDEAIRRNNGFFQFFLQRGLVREKLGDLRGAREDLRKSTSLYPSAHAYNSLGTIALTNGERKRAIEHFRTAASSNSDIGRSARESLARLELPERPERYLALHLKRDMRGYVVVVVGNRSPVTVRGIVIAVRHYDNQGRIIWKGTVYFRRAIRPGRRSEKVTPIGPLIDDKSLRLIHLKIVDVSVAE
jgi:predicted Zn-dependent protease